MRPYTRSREDARQRFRAFVLISTLAIILEALPLPRQAAAQDRPCLADAQRLCKDLAPDDRAGMMQCLKDHETNLSDACKARMQTFAHEPCAQDALTFCKDVESENKRAMVHCLRDHETELTAACKARLHEFWARLL
jgi:hypothetical protein